jgi:aspartate kinase
MLVVQKLGGVTLSSPDKIKQVARAVQNEMQTSGRKLILVVSAMGNSTNDLLKLSREVTPFIHPREIDMLLSVGERISMSLLTMALKDLHIDTVCFTGSQAGVETDDSFSNAQILCIKGSRVQAALDAGQVVVLAGFQGVSQRNKEITTLGRGGSDTTAVAVAAAFGADTCEILKDLPNVYTSDPKIVLNAQKITNLSLQSLKIMTYWGAKMLHHRSAELAYKYRVPMIFKAAPSSLNFNKEGTMITQNISEIFKWIAISHHPKIAQIDIEKINELAAGARVLKIQGGQIYFIPADNSEFPNHKMPIKSSVTAIYEGTLSPDWLNRIIDFSKQYIPIEDLHLEQNSITLFCNCELTSTIEQKLHQLLFK